MEDQTSNGYSSSSDEEEDAQWKAAIESIASTTTFGTKLFGTNGSVAHSKAAAETAQDDQDLTRNPQKLKHYQIKAQKLLDQMLEKTLQIAKDASVPYNDTVANEGGGVRLFKKSRVGIIFDHKDESQRVRKRPKILPKQYFDKDTKKLKGRLRSVAVDGIDIIAAAKSANQKSLSRLEAKEAAAKEKAKKEEERIAELKRIRGEKWLPSMEREMKINKNSR